MVSSSWSAEPRPHRAHAASQPRMWQRHLSCSIRFLYRPTGRHHQFMLDLPVTDIGGQAFAAAAKGRTNPEGGACKSEIWAFAKNITILPGVCLRAKGEKGIHPWVKPANQ